MFEYCVGGDVCRVYVKEVKELCRQAEGNNKRKPHMVGAEKKRQMTVEARNIGR